MGNHGFKVSQPGYDVKTATPSQLVFSSKYQTLKVQQQGSGSITHSGGRTATIAHNLGYVPMFLVHSTIDPLLGSTFGSAADYFISPFRYPIGACHVDRDVIAWVDSTNLYIKVRPNFGWFYSYTQRLSENYADDSDLGYTTGYLYIGEWYGIENGAIRFTNISLNKNESIYKAELDLYIATSQGDDDVIFNIWGIDEDNTLPFDEGDAAFSRTRTTAYKATATGEYGGQTFTVDVKSVVEEIIARASWSSGNAMGFVLMDNGTVENTYIGESINGNPYCSYSNLKYLKSNALMNYKYTIYLNEVDP